MEVEMGLYNDGYGNDACHEGEADFLKVAQLVVLHVLGQLSLSAYADRHLGSDGEFTVETSLEVVALEVDGVQGPLIPHLPYALDLCLRIQLQIIVERDVVGHLALDGQRVTFVLTECGVDVPRSNRALQIQHLAMILTIDGQTVLLDIFDEGDGPVYGIIDIGKEATGLATTSKSLASHNLLGCQCAEACTACTTGHLTVGTHHAIDAYCYGVKHVVGIGIFISTAVSATCRTSIRVDEDRSAQLIILSHHHLTETRADNSKDVLVAYQLLSGGAAQISALIQALPDTHRTAHEVTDAQLVGQSLADCNLSGVSIQDLYVVWSDEV